jgi:KipI family sensor histidine kinase inhibitor
MHEIVLAGENSIIVYFGDSIASHLPGKIKFISDRIQNKLGNIIVDLTQSYTSLHISYNTHLISHDKFCELINRCILVEPDTTGSYHPKIINIPILYDTNVGLDLERLLREKNLTLNKFIDLHASKKYLVYAIGFAPGFAFLGEIDKRIQMPRLDTPRTKVPAGSVGIAQSQTAVYPGDSPGGWNIVGRTPVDLSLKNGHSSEQNNTKGANIFQFSVGDSVIFSAITEQEFLDLGGIL